MALQLELKSLEDVAVELREYYVESPTEPGTFFLDLAEKPLTQISNLETTNGKIREENKTLSSALGRYSFLKDRDIDEVKSMLDQYPELKTLAETAGSNKIEHYEERLKAQVATQTAPLLRELEGHKEELDAARKMIDTYNHQEKKRRIIDEVNRAASEINGLLPSAAEDLRLYGTTNLEISEDGSVRVREDAEPKYAGLTVNKYVQALVADRQNWLGGSQGGGAHGSSNSTLSGKTNPYAKESFNLTAQMKLERENPKQAVNMKLLAGVS